MNRYYAYTKLPKSGRKYLRNTQKCIADCEVKDIELSLALHQALFHFPADYMYYHSILVEGSYTPLQSFVWDSLYKERGLVRGLTLKQVYTGRNYVYTAYTWGDWDEYTGAFADQFRNDNS